MGIQVFFSARKQRTLMVFFDGEHPLLFFMVGNGILTI